MNPHSQTYTDLYDPQPSRLRDVLLVLIGLLIMFAVYTYTSWADAKFEQAQPAVVYHSCLDQHDSSH